MLSREIKTWRTTTTTWSFLFCLLFSSFISTFCCPKMPKYSWKTVQQARATMTHKILVLTRGLKNRTSMRWRVWRNPHFFPIYFLSSFLALLKTNPSLGAMRLPKKQRLHPNSQDIHFKYNYINGLKGQKDGKRHSMKL